MALTRLQAIKNTKKLWEYIAKHNVSKNTAFTALWPGKVIIASCWACQASSRPVYMNCKKCPVWGGTKEPTCPSPNSSYSKFYSARDTKTRRAAAQKIVDLCDAALTRYYANKRS